MRGHVGNFGNGSGSAVARFWRDRTAVDDHVAIARTARVHVQIHRAFVDGATGKNDETVIFGSAFPLFRHKGVKIALDQLGVVVIGGDVPRRERVVGSGLNQRNFRNIRAGCNVISRASFVHSVQKHLWNIFLNPNDVGGRNRDDGPGNRRTDRAGHLQGIAVFEVKDTAKGNLKRAVGTNGKAFVTARVVCGTEGKKVAGKNLMDTVSPGKGCDELNGLRGGHRPIADRGCGKGHQKAVERARLHIELLLSGT